MPLRKYATRHFYRTLFASQLKTVTILKRNDDQQQGTVRSCLVFECLREEITKRGQTLQNDMVSDHTTTWQIPAAELERVGINYLNPLDRIVEDTDDGGMPLATWRYWQPESDTNILMQLFENMIRIDCKRVDPTPPVGPNQLGA